MSTSPPPRRRGGKDPVRPRASVLGALAIASDAADELLLGTVRDVHGAVAERVYGVTHRATSGSSRVVEEIHDRASSAVYAGIGAGLRATSRGLREADRRGYGALIDDSTRGRTVVSAVNGLMGDRLVEQQSPLAIELAVRDRGVDVPVRDDALEAAFPDATGDLVIFLHGLGEHERHWHHRAQATGGSYGDRLAAETSWTPVYLRANTGLPVAVNGVALASLLDRLVESWPTEVRRIALVGHSMGGLIMRAACAVVTDAAARGRTGWNHLVTDVVTLGTPHLGAPLERGVALGAKALSRLPESAPFGRILEYRSVGILDLRSGLAPDVQNLPHARYHLVAATLADSRRHPVSEAFGDMMVRYPSATGRPRRGREMFPGADVLHVKGGHFDLLNHPEVHTALVSWLA
ncbi:MAG: alpha/beta fold hydrolase [Nocardioidaceae bacterium]